MQKINYEEECKNKFSKMTDIDIIEVFNTQVGNTGWTTSRGIYLSCLKTEMCSRPFDLSAIYNGELSFKKKIKLMGNKIVVIKE